MSETRKSHVPDTARLDLPAVLLPYQVRWIQDDSQLKIIEKSRRTGLTWAEAADDVTIAARSKASGGQNVYYIGYNADMAIEYIEACAMWARIANEVAGSVEEGIWEDGKDDKHIKTFTIQFPNSGHRIVALSSRPANLRGKQGVVVIDEAAFHDALHELIKAALALLIWGGKVRIISTHNGDLNPFNELIGQIRAGKRKGTVHRITFQEAIEEGLYQRICLRLDKPWAAETQLEWVKDVYKFYGDGATEELDVVPSQGTGTYLASALIEARMQPAPILRLKLEDMFSHMSEESRKSQINDWCDEHLRPLLRTLNPLNRHLFGVDFARSGDLSVYAPMEIAQTLTRVVPFLIELRNVPFEQQKQILFYLIDSLPRFSGGALDARGNGQYLAEVTQLKYGAGLVDQVMLSDKWYLENMPAFKAAFEDATLIVPKDADVLEDIRAIRLVNGIAKIDDRRSGTSGNKRHGDSAIAIALAHFATRKDHSEIDYRGAPPRSERWDGPSPGNDNPYRERGGW